MNIKLKEELIKTRKLVKQKFNAVKTGRIHAENLLEESYKPITKTLNTFLSKSIKTEIQPKPELDLKQSSIPQPQKELSFLDQADETIYSSDAIQPPPRTPTPEPEHMFSSDEIQDAAFTEYLEDFGPLPRGYIEDSIRDTEDKFDHHYGVRHDIENNKFYIGNTELMFEGNDFFINNIKYIGTPGLYELLFKKQPIGYKPADQANYKDIVNRTNAHRRNYHADGQISGNRSDKYKRLIQPIFLDSPILSQNKSRVRSGTFSGRIGRGMILNNKPIEYVYWDDPNELVDRLRLLIASQNAGNNSHNNEIISIIEELRETNIIEN